MRPCPNPIRENEGFSCQVSVKLARISMPCVRELWEVMKKVSVKLDSYRTAGRPYILFAETAIMLS